MSASKKVTAEDLPKAVRDYVSPAQFEAALKRLNAGRSPESGNPTLDALMEMARAKK